MREGEFKWWGILRGKKFLWLLKLIADHKGKDNPRLQKMSKCIEKYMHARAGNRFRTGLSFLFHFPFSSERRRWFLCYTVLSIHLTWDFSVNVCFLTSMLETWRAPFSLAAAVWEVVCSFTKSYCSRRRKACGLMTHPFMLVYEIISWMLTCGGWEAARVRLGQLCYRGTNPTAGGCWGDHCMPVRALCSKAGHIQW